MNTSLANDYNAVCAASISKWSLAQGAGNKPQDPPFPPSKLAITTGSFVRSQAISQLLSEIRQQIAGDPLADLMQAECAHFTFLALTPQIYDSRSDLPSLGELHSLFARHCRGNLFTIRRLRLVALPNALLLAGLPCEETFSLRDSFAKSVLASTWQDQIRARYPNGPIPPQFWHSTLLRYHADFVPDQIQRFFISNQVVEYGDVSLPIKLMAANYNWEIALPIDDEPS